MKAKKRLDYKKSKKRKFSFLLVIPVVVVFLVLALFVFDKESNKDISGKVTQVISLNDDVYRGGEDMDGRLKISLDRGDFLPLNSNLTILLVGLYPLYYKCLDGTEVMVYDENGNATDSITNFYSCDGTIGYYDCKEAGKKCCGSSGVEGKMYFNLYCDDVPAYYGSGGYGFCGNNCTEPYNGKLSNFIAKSFSPNKGNFTIARYRYVNSTNGTVMYLEGSGNTSSSCFFNDTQYEGGWGYVQYPPQDYPTCDDNDSMSLGVLGMCTDYLGNHPTDYCIGGTSKNVAEYSCKLGRLLKSYSCDSCSVPTCRNDPSMYVTPPPVTSDAVSSPPSQPYDPTPEGWYSSCPNLSNIIAVDRFGGTIYGKKEVLVKAADCYPNALNAVPVCFNNQAWFDPYYCQGGQMDCENGCSGGACIPGAQQPSNISMGNCGNWSPMNMYEAPLSAFVDAPNTAGSYTVHFALGYENITYSFFNSDLITVKASHRVCQNNACVRVTGPGDNECSSNSQCGGGCYPNWQCNSWGACLSGQQTRTCLDANNCGILTGKPNETQACACSPSWSCSWNECSLGTNQDYLCSDLNNCNANNLTYAASSRACCQEDWQCTVWGSCVNGQQSRGCSDMNLCSTSFNQPTPFNIRECETTSDFPWWVLIVIFTVVVLGVVVIVIFLLKKKGANKSSTMHDSFNTEPGMPPAGPGASQYQDLEIHQEQNQEQQDQSSLDEEIPEAPKKIRKKSKKDDEFSDLSKEFNLNE